MKYKNTWRFFFVASRGGRLCSMLFFTVYLETEMPSFGTQMFRHTTSQYTFHQKKKNKTDFVCESVPRSGVWLHLCTETRPLGSQSVPRCCMLGPNRKKVLFLKPHLASHCILQRQISSTNDADLRFKNLSKTLTLCYTVYPKNTALKKMLHVFVLMAHKLVFTV